MVKVTDKLVLFWQADSVFSNWYPAEFTYDGEKFENSEACFIYRKAQVFGDTEAIYEILDEQSPAYVKRIGREISGFTEEKWIEVREQCMYDACYAKFSQNEEFKKVLLGTGNRELVEASPYDKIWGIGLSPADPEALRKENWKGLNLLGKVLMRVRDDLLRSRAEASSAGS